MKTASPHVLYIGSVLPSLSETFVYREVLELKKRGRTISVASVRQPQRNLGNSELDRLADDAIPVYATGFMAIIIDALCYFVFSPSDAIKALSRCLLDALFGPAVPIKRRPKVVLQGLAALALAHRCRKLAPGLSHIHAHMAHVPTTIAMYAAMALRIPFSFTGHAADLFRDYSLLPTKLKRCEFVACISHWHQGFYDTIAGHLPEQKTPVVRCGVDTQQFHPVEKTARDQFYILAVGRLVEKKGFDTLIKACGKLRQDGFAFELDIVGDGEKMEALADLAAKNGLSASLVGGKNNDEIRRLMQRANVFVLPCRATKSGDRDGIPVVLMEAMSCGIPVISGDLETIRELIDHDDNGVMIPPGSDKALYEWLRRLMTDKPYADRIAKRGRQKIQDEFSITKNVDRLESALKFSDSLPD